MIADYEVPRAFGRLWRVLNLLNSESTILIAMFAVPHTSVNGIEG